MKLPALPWIRFRPRSAGAADVSSILPERIGWRDHAIGALLGLAYVVWLLATARSLGFPRDEGVYFRAGSEYMRWVRLLFDHATAALEPGAIDSAWSTNHEHPALMKTLFGASHYFFYEKWHLFKDESTAYRLPGMASAGLAMWVIYLFGARAWGRKAGLVAAILFALMPRVFFHAHLACFDVPITAIWILCIYVHWRAQEKRSLGWAIATGIVYGLALETKHNAWILPGALVPHALFVERHAIWRSLRVARVSLPASVVAMATIGPLVFVALWPYLWHDTLARVQGWFEFHLHHEYYNIEFLGKNYFGPPSPVADVPVMILATVPSVTLLLFLVGAADRAAVAARRLVRAALAWSKGARERFERSWPALSSSPPRDRAETDLLLALSFCAAIGPFFLSKTPIFGATKHWLPAYPVLAMFAGRGFQLVIQAMRRALPGLAGGRRWRRGARAGGVRGRRALRRHRALASLRPVGVRAARRRNGRRGGPRAEPAVLGVHDADGGRGVPESEGPARSDRLPSRHDVGRVDPHARGGAGARRPAGQRRPGRGAVLAGAARAPHERGRLRHLGDRRDGRTRLCRRARRRADREHLPTKR